MGAVCPSAEVRADKRVGNSLPGKSEGFALHGSISFPKVKLDRSMAGESLLDSALSGWKDPVKSIRRALDTDAFELHCQPVRAMQGTDRYPLAEILLRMQEEEKALLPPGQFLPIFEHYRMMPELDRWVARHVIKHLAAGSKISSYSVNLSMQTLDDPAFPDFVRKELSAAKVAPKALLFEIDETDLLMKTDAVEKAAAALKSIGVGIAVDGFGRKSVSFRQAVAMRLDFMKVDGSITRQV